MPRQECAYTSTELHALRSTGWPGNVTVILEASHVDVNISTSGKFNASSFYSEEIQYKLPRDSPEVGLGGVIRKEFRGILVSEEWWVPPT